jgi:ABC-type uncharacterized transport system substrate-binding protein
VTRTGHGRFRVAALVTLAIAVGSARDLAAAEVVVLKSNDVADWRPALDAIRRVASAQAITEFDLRGLKEEAARVLDGLKAKAGEAIFVAVGPLAAGAVHEAFPQSRIIFCMVQDPVALGLLKENGVTGVAFAVPLRNQLAAFRMVNPAGVRIGVVYKPEATDSFIQDATAAAASVRLALVPKTIASEKDVPNALRSLLSGGEAVDALWLVPDAIMLGDDTRRFVMSETLKAGRPVYAFSAALIPEGALVSDGPDIASIGEEVGELVNRLAAGEKGRIDMLMPRADLVINKKIAGKLKVEIPGDALRAAARVY